MCCKWNVLSGYIFYFLKYGPCTDAIIWTNMRPRKTSTGYIFFYFIGPQIWERKRKKGKGKSNETWQKEANKKSFLESSAFQKKKIVIVVVFCYFFHCSFLRNFVKFWEQVKTMEPLFWRKKKNNPASFMKHYKRIGPSPYKVYKQAKYSF